MTTNNHTEWVTYLISFYLYRRGNYKIVQGNIRDPHWYQEPIEDRVSTSDKSFFHRIIEANTIHTYL